MDANTLSTTTVEGPVVEDGARDVRARVHFVLGRIAYWTPVLAVLVLFALVSFRGLRPALSEASRLAAAEEVLTARHARAVEKNHAIQLQLAARQDPVFRERQRRLRTIQPATPIATQNRK